MQNKLYKFVHPQLLNPKYKFVYLQLFDIKILFSEKLVFRKQKRTTAYGCESVFWILRSPGKMMTCYLQDTNKFLRYRTLRTSILNCGFPIKGVKLTRFVLFEVTRVLQLRGTLLKTISVGIVLKHMENKGSFKVKNFSVTD